jgi:uncharacterized protein YhdP
VSEIPAEALERPAARAAVARVRLCLGVLAALLVFLGALLLARELIRAQVPRQRAALENLIRQETGLEVAFERLSVRWGWYGPEAVFFGVSLGSPDSSAVLRCAQLVVAVDAWRSGRSGHLEAGRIRLLNPELDLSARTGLARAPATAGAEGALPEARRLLAGWRGGRIDIDNGVLHLASSAGAHALTLNVRHAELRRLGELWSADAQVQLPQPLGTELILQLRMQGDLANPADLGGTLSVRGAHLDFAGWRRLDALAALSAYLPVRGEGSAELAASFEAGTLRQLDGRLEAQGAEWAPRGEAVALALPQLGISWQARRQSARWRLQIERLDLGAGEPATGVAQFAPGSAHVTLEQLPAANLAALLHWWGPQLPLTGITVGGRAARLELDWDAHRSPGARLLSAADLEDLSIESAPAALRLSGLSAQLRGRDAAVTLALQAGAAHLLALREQPVDESGIALHGTVNAILEGSRWHLSSEDFGASLGAGHLAARLTLSGTPGAVPELSGNLALGELDAALATALLGEDALRALGLAGLRVSAGTITEAQLTLGGLASAPPRGGAGEMQGALAVRELALDASERWPELDSLAGRLEWRGNRVRMHLEHATSGALRLEEAHAQWDVRNAQPLLGSARLSGNAAAALEWLRSHPQLGAAAPLAQYLDLSGDAQLNVELLAPRAHGSPPRLRLTAALAGARLRPLGSLPQIESLRGTLMFSSAELQRSTLTGRWFGGPVTLGIAARPHGRASSLSVSARGVMEARQALIAAGATEQNAAVSGAAEWSAQLQLTPQTDTGELKWTVHVDSTLAGLASTLPEPFAKAAGAALPLRLDLTGAASRAQLHLSLGERLQAAAALTRSGEGWRIERGVLHSGAAAAVQLPAEPVLALEGHLPVLDLGAFLALWQQASQSQTLPPLRARLGADQLLAGRSYAEATLTAATSEEGTQISLESQGLSGSLHSPGRTDPTHPLLLQLAQADAELDLPLLAALPLPGRPAELAVEELRLGGRALGQLRARLSAAEGAHVAELHVRGGPQELEGVLECAAQLHCTLRAALASTDLAATLEAFGARADLSARRARLEGELQWPQGSGAPLATISGHLHMQLEDGATRSSPQPDEAAPFALLLVPALMRALNNDPGRGEGPPQELHYARLAADFALRDGQASTSNLHLDGPDAEILMRARVNLLARDYDAQAFVLRGEERLPAPLRRLGATPRIAALWLSLREWFGGGAAEEDGTALRLRGPWNDPIVMAAE